MAPEQARGGTVDRRADIWAFGVVLFEMLSGRRPFDGETSGDLLAATLKEAPAWQNLPAGVPPGVRRLLRRLLEKDPRKRLRDMGDARLAIEDLRSGGAGVVDAAPAPADPWWRRALPWSVAIVAVAVAGFALREVLRPPPEAPPLRYTIAATAGALERSAMPVLSPDGRHLAFVKNGALWLQPLNQIEPRPLAGASDAHHPFWSPDSREVAYLTTTTLWRVAIDGGPPVRVANAAFSRGGRTPGGAWLDDGTIVFAPAATGSGLLAVPAQGGEFTEFYARDPKTETDFHRPSVLPDGRSLLFVVDRATGSADTIGVLVNGARKDVLTIAGETVDSPVYSPTGHILYHREISTPGVWALPFSMARLEATGAPFLVAAQGSFPTIGANGVLAYAENGLSGQSRLAWLDMRTSAVTPAFNETFPTITQPRLSPDGTRVAAVVQSREEGQWLIVADLRRQTYVRLGDRANANSRPAWRDDQTIIFGRDDRSTATLHMGAADGSGDLAAIGPGMHPYVARRRLVYSMLQAGRGGDLYHAQVPVSGAIPRGEVLQQLPAHEWEPALSPDGRLLVYIRGDAGQSEVILRTYPDASGQWQVSSQGGTWPEWSPGGDAIYYRDSPGLIRRVEVRAGPPLTLGPPEVVRRPAQLISRAGFDVSRDGTRLLMVEEVTAGDRPPLVAIVQNWPRGVASK